MKKTFLMLALMWGAACINAAPPNAATKLAQLPPAVQKVIHEQQGDSKLVDVAKKTEGGEALYSVKISEDGKGRTFTVSLDGSVSRMPLALGETPAPVQNIIRAKTARAKLGEIYKVTERGAVTFEIDLSQEAKERDFTVDSLGQLVSEKVFLEELPAAMKKTITEETGGGTLEDITKTFQNAEATFEVEFSRGGKKRSLTLDAEGKVMGEEMFLEELPKAVQTLIQETTQGGKLGGITQLIEDEEIVYDVEMTKNGRTRNFTVDEDGNLLGMQVYLVETPAPVQKTIQAQMKESKLGTITRVMDDEDVTFQVEMRRNGMEHNFTVNTNGLMLDVEVFLEMLPEAVKKAIMARVKTNEIDGITKTFDEDKESYDVDYTTGEKTRLLSVDPTGTVTHEEESLDLAETPEPVRQAIQARLTKAKLTSITKTTESGKIAYEIELDENGEGSAVTLDGDGKVVDPDSQ